MFRFTALILTAALSLAACTGTQGPDGPQGPQGAQGTPGKDGAAGPKGDAGTNGAAGTVGQPGVTGPIGPGGAMGPIGPVGPGGPKGDPGAPGPVGPVGPGGPKGDPGTPGAPGAPGAPGSANVVYSAWATSQPTAIKYNSSENTCTGKYIIKNIGLSKYQNPLLLVYIRINGTIFPVPTRLNGLNADFLYKSDDSLEVYRDIPVVDQTFCNVLNTAFSQDIRYFIIPGGQLLGSQSLNSALSLKGLSYAEIQQRFGLLD